MWRKRARGVCASQYALMSESSKNGAIENAVLFILSGVFFMGLAYLPYILAIKSSSRLET
jgi:hypothetical protein